jgi:aerobic-type carbon monoxide dehydrogenase small subunit (CoxS/CutS family)
MPQPLSLIINGEPYTLLVEPYCSLLDMLRDQLQLTGTKKKAATRAIAVPAPCS